MPTRVCFNLVNISSIHREITQHTLLPFKSPNQPPTAKPTERPTATPTQKPTAKPTPENLGTPTAINAGTRTSPLTVEGADASFVIRILPDRATPATDQGPLVVNRIVSQHEGFGRRLIDKEKEEVDAELGFDGGDAIKRRGRRLAEDDTPDRLVLHMTDLIETRLSGGKDSEPEAASYNEEDEGEASRRLANYRGGKPNSKPTWRGDWKPTWDSKPTWKAPAPTPTWTKPTWNTPLPTKPPTSPPTKVCRNIVAARCKPPLFRLADCQNSLPSHRQTDLSGGAG